MFKDKLQDVEEESKNYQEKLNELQKIRDPSSVEYDLNSLYDAILDIKKFSDFGKDGWDLKINTIEGEGLIRESELGSTVSIVGMYDKGKTFLLNKLAGSNFQPGKKFTTHGLSIKRITIDGTNFIGIDTAGINSPLIPGQNEKEHKKTELFIQDLSFSLANYFILVINDFKAQDQKLLNTIMTKIVDKKKYEL